MSAADAAQRLAAGAALVQLYTGLVYQGPGLVKEVATRHQPPAIRQNR
jgi:dihydroorotate dehydrogenase